MGSGGPTGGPASATPGDSMMTPQPSQPGGGDIMTPPSSALPNGKPSRTGMT